MNKNIKIVIYVILSLVLVGISFLSITHIYNKNHDGDSKSKQAEKEKEQKKETYHVYAEYDFDSKVTSLYKLDENLNEDLLVDNAAMGTYAYSVYKNFLFYFDKSGQLYRYDLKTNEKSPLNMKINNINFSYEMQAYEHYLVLVYSGGFYIYDFDNSKYEKLNLSIHNYSYIFNEERKELYYIPKNDSLYSYNIETKEKKLFMHDARPLLVKDGLLYFSTLDNKSYYTYDYARETIDSITYVDFILANYNTDKSYISEENKIREVTHVKEETIYTIEDVYTIDKLVVLDKYLLISGLTDDLDDNYYIYDIKERKISEVQEDDILKYYSIIDSLYLRYVN